MNPRQFLLIGGIILLVLGVVGFFIGPVMPAWFWLDAGENVAHTVLGLVALAAYQWLTNAVYRKWLVVLVGVIAILAAVIGFLVPAGSMSAYNVGIANLENPADNLLHLVVGVWALWAALGPQAREARVPATAT